MKVIKRNSVLHVSYADVYIEESVDDDSGELRFDVYNVNTDKWLGCIGRETAEKHFAILDVD